MGFDSSYALAKMEVSKWRTDLLLKAGSLLWGLQGRPDGFIHEKKNVATSSSKEGSEYVGESRHELFPFFVQLVSTILSQTELIF